jgi:membrane protein required for colicin V production
MAPLDWFVVAVLVVSLLVGALRGLVYEVMSVISWVAAFIVAQMLAPQAAALLPIRNASEPIRYAAGFVLVFIVVVFAGALLAWLIKKMITAVGLRPVDRALGAVFGLVRGVILLLTAAVVINMTPLKDANWWVKSRAADMSATTLKSMKPMLPEQFGRYLPG